MVESNTAARQLLKQVMQGNRSDLDIVYHVDQLHDDSERFRCAAEWVADSFDLIRLTTSISIVDDATIHRLNRDFLNHDWPTDVISFVFESQDGQVNGEIIASSDMAQKMHQAAGWAAEDELLLYVVHGLLHLAGMNDVDEDEQREMRVAERNCLLDMGVTSASEHLERWRDISY